MKCSITLPMNPKFPFNSLMFVYSVVCSPLLWDRNLVLSTAVGAVRFPRWRRYDATSVPLSIADISAHRKSSDRQSWTITCSFSTHGSELIRHSFNDKEIRMLVQSHADEINHLLSFQFFVRTAISYVPFKIHRECHPHL